MQYKGAYSKNGFTLIELLIVIAVLGVLAAIALVVLNPIEQLRRGRDAARITGVEQLGKAWLDYYTAQGLASYPAAASGWQTNILKASGDLQNPIIDFAPVVACGGAANYDSGFCYVPINGNADFAVWVNLESTNEKSKAGNCANQTAAVEFGSLGKVQLDCLATATTIPATSDSLYNP